MNYEGSVTIILGCMFSGKSTELLRRIRRGEIANKKSVLIKYAKDTRYCDEEICTHDRIKRVSYKSERLYETYNSNKNDFDGSDQIGIDEGQFFPDLVEFCEEMANKGKEVFVALLNGNFARKEFEVNQIGNLIAISDEVVQMRAICNYCKKSEASFSKRIVDSTETEVIGGTDKYNAACRECYHIVANANAISNE